MFSKHWVASWFPVWRPNKNTRKHLLTAKSNEMSTPTKLKFALVNERMSSPRARGQSLVWKNYRRASSTPSARESFVTRHSQKVLRGRHLEHRCICSFSFTEIGEISEKERISKFSTRTFQDEDSKTHTHLCPKTFTCVRASYPAPRQKTKEWDRCDTWNLGHNS